MVPPVRSVLGIENSTVAPGREPVCGHVSSLVEPPHIPRPVVPRVFEIGES